jgi:para-aminobenzoate synthetase/4-amino-4-deoxychorismate lyase
VSGVKTLSRSHIERGTAFFLWYILLMKQPFVLLETDRRDVDNDRSFSFERPVRVLRLDAGGDVGEFFAELDRALADGLWAAGYFAYELGYLFEPRLTPLLERKRPAGPLAWLGLFESPAPAGGRESPVMGDDACRISNLSLNVTRDEYLGAIRRIKSWIADGETYQVNFTMKHRFRLEGAPEALYADLRRRQSVSYSACIFDGERTVISLSPELFFERDGETIRVKPMKGTVGRGADEREDDELAAWLAADAKNRAENVMIVDMVRNDLGRVAPPGGVKVPKLFEVERYETLHQMTSTVVARVPRETPWFDVMRTLFPCASVTGAPKIRTMELIADLEKEPRGVYTGAIGYIAPDGRACFNVAIRTIVAHGDGDCELGIGSGVIFDSDALAEYEECLLKGKFLTGIPDGFELVETMRLEDGEIYLLERHLKRLESSAAHFGFQYDGDRVAAALDETTRSRCRGAYKIRLLVAANGRCDVSVSPLGPPPTSFRVKLSGEAVDPGDEFRYHKTTHRPMYVRERNAAVAEGCDEVLFLNTRNEVCEGSISNVFVETGGEMFTPPVSCGLLPGTLREELIALGTCRERILNLSDLQNADLIYVGNSVSGLVTAKLDD